MATKTLIKKGTPLEYSNGANGSSARKFTTSDSVQNNSPGDSTSNAEHSVKIATSLKTIALVAQSVAARARGEIEQVGDALGETTREIDPIVRGRSSAPDQRDLIRIRKNLSGDIARDFDQVKDRRARQQLRDSVDEVIAASNDVLVRQRQENGSSQTVNMIVPDVESVTVDVDGARGSGDRFYSKIVFNVRASDAEFVKAFRIFRAKVENPVYTRELSVISSHGIDIINSLKIGRKNQDSASSLESRLRENGVDNAISRLNPVDPYTNLRTSPVADPSSLVPPESVGAPRPKTFDRLNIPEALSHLDPSVLDNIGIIANLRRTSNSSFGVNVYSPGVPVGKSLNIGLKIDPAQSGQSRDAKSKSQFVVDKTNRILFSEIAFYSPNKLSSKRIGDYVEYSYIDNSISYGSGYKYFVVSVDANMNQSSRSSIVDCVVEGIRIPARPSEVNAQASDRSVTLTISVDDQLVEKFEIYRREEDTNRKISTVSTTISDGRGYTASSYLREIEDNGFLLIGETINVLKRGASFIDNGTMIGRRYTYRVYSVDVFGNKSESPFESIVYVPDPEQCHVDLIKPVVVAEVDATSHKIKVTFSCDDEKVEKLRLTRRDLTIGQNSFTTPISPPRLVMGRSRPLRRNLREGEIIRDTESVISWTGLFDNTGVSQVFVDKTTAYDHIYQYRISGEDRYGNVTSHDVSDMIMLTRQPILNAPLDLSSSLSTGSDSSISGVQLSWIESNLDVSAEELVGSQSALQDSSVRTLYQIERKKDGDAIWRQFSMISGTSFFDEVGTTQAPNHRPPYLEVNKLYSYRVKAYQRGAFVSNFCSPIDVFVGFNPGAPLSLELRTPPVQRRPFFVMLNWDVQSNSGVIDRWEIERAEVNNFAAARLNSKNPSDFENLEYLPFRTVYLESSRFSGKVQDNFDPSAVNGSLIVSPHYYADFSVDFGNSYFYRIRSVSVDGRATSWTYKGIKVTSSAFESKWLPTVTDEEKQLLTRQLAPLRLSRGSQMVSRSSLGLQPTYSMPPSLRTSPLIKVDS